LVVPFWVVLSTSRNLLPAVEAHGAALLMVGNRIDNHRHASGRHRRELVVGRLQLATELRVRVACCASDQKHHTIAYLPARGFGAHVRSSAVGA
jgi:hypothetical protein